MLRGYPHCNLFLVWHASLLFHPGHNPLLFLSPTSLSPPAQAPSTPSPTQTTSIHLSRIPTPLSSTYYEKPSDCFLYLSTLLRDPWREHYRSLCICTYPAIFLTEAIDARGEFELDFHRSSYCLMRWICSISGVLWMRYLSIYHSKVSNRILRTSVCYWCMIDWFCDVEPTLLCKLVRFMCGGIIVDCYFFWTHSIYSILFYSVPFLSVYPRHARTPRSCLVGHGHDADVPGISDDWLW